MGGRPSSSSARMVAMRAAWSSCAPWLKFSRNTSAPPRNSRPSISGVLLAGPIVATILVRRRRRNLGCAILTTPVCMRA